MGSGHERGRGEEPFSVGQRVGSHEGVCSAEWYTWGKLSSAPGAHATDLLEGRGPGHHRMLCQEGSSSGGGVGRGGAAQLLPPASLPPLAPGHRNSPKSRSSSVRAPAHPVPGSTLGESQGW